MMRGTQLAELIACVAVVEEASFAKAAMLLGMVDQMVMAVALSASITRWLPTHTRSKASCVPLIDRSR
jgi:hypothetical protein